jgi:hypothetical protein
VNLISRIERLKDAALDKWLATKTEKELEAIVGHDEIGQKLRSLEDAELERIAKGGRL